MQVSTEMMKGTVVPIVLKLLSERSMYGYEIIKEVNRRTENLLDWKEGTLYPWLHRLEGEGLVSGRWMDGGGARQRKYYGLTRLGRARLKECTAEWTALSKAVSGILLTPA
ncbi:MAG: lineage-specific thermal regulator protein [Lentisphaerae bacterium ADurb.BinA184]|nr:MAG: lineage-specific thermal regulator protein [Lentisphaerae bacterium ADurb.BinA184]